MSAATTAATAATTAANAAISAAAVSRSRRTRAVIDAFRLAGATAAERAVSLDAIGVTQGPEVVGLARLGILMHDARDDRWWLSEAAVITHRDAPPRKAIKLLLALIAISLLIIAIGMVFVVRDAR